MKLDSEMRHLRQFDLELATLETKKRELTESIEGFALQRSQLDDALAVCGKQLKRLEDRVVALVSANPWIREHSS